MVVGSPYPTLTVPSLPVTYRATAFTDPAGTLPAATYVIVGQSYPSSSTAPSNPSLTLTRTSGSQTFIATSVTTVAGSASNVAIITVPTQAPFKVSVTDFSNNFYGYLDVLDTVFSGTAHECGLTQTFSSASYFFIDPTSSRLVCSSGAGTSSQLHSCQRSGTSNSPFLFDLPGQSINSDVLTTFWSDNTLHVSEALGKRPRAKIANILTGHQRG